MTNVLTNASRRVPLAGVYNLRDTGGHPAGARTTRWRKLFRSDALHKLTDGDRAALVGLGIATLIDLREDDEVAKEPNAVDGTGITQLRHPLYDGPLALAGQRDLLAINMWLVANSGERIADAIRVVATSGDDAVLVHCTAGKDRTGLTIALMLSAVGVGDRDVAADYCLSEIMLAGEWADAMLASFDPAILSGDADIRGIVTGSPASVMLAVLAEIRSRYGDAAGYLVAHGLAADELAALRAALLF
jgi:protein-tyrosine phosphatase